MHISWIYLDKKKAAVDALESYDDMDYIIRHTDEDIAKAESRLYGVGSRGMDGLPHAHDVKAVENRIINGIEDIDVMKERYRQASEFMEWFNPAWEKLSEDERYVLEAFFMDEGKCSSGDEAVAAHFGIERASAYRKKNRALDHLALLLYGKA